MTRLRAGSAITGVAAIGFWGSAALHSSGYSWAVRASAQAPEMVRSILPMLWLAIGFDLAVLGLIVAVVARWPAGPARIILAAASICPFVDAGLQVRFLGFIPPTPILIGVGVMTLIGAMVLPPAPATPARAAA